MSSIIMMIVISPKQSDTFPLTSLRRQILNTHKKRTRGSKIRCYSITVKRILELPIIYTTRHVVYNIIVASESWNGSTRYLNLDRAREVIRRVYK